ncbi:MAG: T9SS type A sorting domain-containing protein [Saprospiraceae bacterium]|nr:T9SS type A sorting domain-containing protein [Candidatus Defluviibacterium haderslevense]MCC7026227.1 T9SS type A sorting domain-containing protein [Saprospiraceae bacterium]
MKRFSVYLLILFFLATHINAQYNFDLVIPSFEYKVEAIFSPAIEIQDTIYSFVANQYAYKYGNSSSIAKVSNKGQIISNIDFLDSINPYWVADTKRISDGVLISGAQFIYNRRGFSLYYAKLNNAMDTIWSKTINTKYNSPGLYGIIELSNGNIFIAGNDCHTRSTGGTYPDSCDPIIILADRLGNIIKYVKLEKPDPINTFEALLDLKEDSENNIYATGRISVNTLYNRGLIIKFNPKGEIIWRKEFTESGYGIALNYLDELADGTLIAIGSIGKPFFDNNPHLNYLILRIDKDGKTISSKRVFRSYDGGPQNCVKDRFGNYICVANIQKDANSYINGYLTKFSPDGDSIWTREFSHRDDRDEGFYNIALASDGGYYLTGLNWISDEDHSSKGWIVKTDSNGCVIPGCTTAVNVEKENNGDLFNLFPNPVSDHLSIYLNDEDLQDRRYHLKCFDQNGRIVLTQAFSGRKTDVDVSSLITGMYFYQINDGRKMVQSGKLVIR